MVLFGSDMVKSAHYIMLYDLHFLLLILMDSLCNKASPPVFPDLGTDTDLYPLKQMHSGGVRSSSTLIQVSVRAHRLHLCFLFPEELFAFC